MTHLAETFVAHLSNSAIAKEVGLDVLETALVGLVERAREGNGEFGIGDTGFVAHAASRVRVETGLLGAVESLHAADLWLAFACAEGCKLAQKQFVENYMTLVRTALLPFVKQGLDVEDVAQRVMDYLLFPRKQLPPAIGGYSGSGPLTGYLRVSVVREAVRRAKKDKRMPPAEEIVAKAVASDSDPELEALKARYRHEFKKAFSQAVQELEQDEVLLLRYHYYSGLGVREIASLMGSSKSGVGRELSVVRQKLLQRTHRLLMANANIRKSEAKSVIRLVKSQLDMGLSRFLK